LLPDRCEIRDPGPNTEHKTHKQRQQHNKTKNTTQTKTNKTNLTQQTQQQQNNKNKKTCASQKLHDPQVLRSSCELWASRDAHVFFCWGVFVFVVFGLVCDTKDL
jgi:hypothetical protein